MKMIQFPYNTLENRPGIPLSSMKYSNILLYSVIARRVERSYIVPSAC